MNTEDPCRCGRLHFQTKVDARAGIRRYSAKRPGRYVVGRCVYRPSHGYVFTPALRLVRTERPRRLERTRSRRDLAWAS